jgi:hypothetical protein
MEMKSKESIQKTVDTIMSMDRTRHPANTRDLINKLVKKFEGLPSSLTRKYKVCEVTSLHEAYDVLDSAHFFEYAKVGLGVDKRFPGVDKLIRSLEGSVLQQPLIRGLKLMHPRYISWNEFYRSFSRAVSKIVKYIHKSKNMIENTIFYIDNGCELTNQGMRSNLYFSILFLEIFREIDPVLFSAFAPRCSLVCVSSLFNLKMMHMKHGKGSKKVYDVFWKTSSREM